MLFGTNRIRNVYFRLPSRLTINTICYSFNDDTWLELVSCLVSSTYPCGEVYPHMTSITRSRKMVTRGYLDMAKRSNYPIEILLLSNLYCNLPVSDCIMDSRRTDVGFVGLGTMGLPMAINLGRKLPQGSKLYAYDISQDALQKLGAALPDGKVVACKSTLEVINHVVGVLIALHSSFTRH